MKMKIVAAAIMSIAMGASVAATHNETTVKQDVKNDVKANGVKSSVNLSTDVDKLSYSIGIDLGSNFKKQEINVNPEVLAKGMQDGMTGNSLLTEQQMQDVLNKFQKDLIAKRTEQMQKKADENKRKGEEFLKDNKAKPGVVTTASGLQYKILTAGTGEKPGKDDTVTVEYTGRLINGEVFDSTEKSGKPATFKVSQVIPGWTEALQLMPAGSKWEVYVPGDLAYGPRSMGGAIGPNETLIFNIHLISVKKD